MILQDSLEPLWRNFRIPDAVRINHQPWAGLAHPKTECLRPHHIEIEFFRSFLDVIPRFLAFDRFTAIRTKAEKNMTLSGANVSLCYRLLERTARFLWRHLP